MLFWLFWFDKFQQLIIINIRSVYTLNIMCFLFYKFRSWLWPVNPHTHNTKYPSEVWDASPYNPLEKLKRSKEADSHNLSKNCFQTTPQKMSSKGGCLKNLNSAIHQIVNFSNFLNFITSGKASLTVGHANTIFSVFIE